MTAGLANPGAPRVITFGCRLNAVQSQALRERRDEDLADAVVFNTCAVTAEAVRQARQAIRRARREQPNARLVVTGCAAQIDSGAFSAMEEVDLVVGNVWRPGVFARQGARERVGDILAEAEAAPAVTGLAGRARAYVAIQNGCDHRCTFCVIPYGRGNSRSQDAEAVISQVRAMAVQGYREVVLTGVDLTSWGADLDNRPKLGDLIAAILEAVPGLARLRLSSIDAAEIDERLLGLIGAEPRLMPYLHLSLQSGDDLILKRMKRRHSRADALALLAMLRRARPDIALGADFIAGFPTESEAAFNNTLAFVEEARLAFLHVFPYSARPGTPAARMPQHSPELIHARARRLRAAGDAALARHLADRIGARVTALVERPGRARAEDFTEITFDGEAPPGALVRGEIIAHDGARARFGDWKTA
ncbi:MAG TPA: tRNA (N(6)-L-threonylcarbamoyladenosine(37)-C(2))-methylthiotransferase MtaB [Caulobacteraceae bacterium]|jgi:threonylcarbamoyladenosine tRNA methylthiotransferase MtaB